MVRLRQDVQSVGLEMGGINAWGRHNAGPALDAQTSPKASFGGDHDAACFGRRRAALPARPHGLQRYGGLPQVPVVRAARAQVRRGRRCRPGPAAQRAQHERRRGACHRRLPSFQERFRHPALHSAVLRTWRRFWPQRRSAPAPACRVYKAKTAYLFGVALSQLRRPSRARYQEKHSMC